MCEWVEHPFTGQLTLERRWSAVRVVIDGRIVFDTDAPRAQSIDHLITTLASYIGSMMHVGADGVVFDISVTNAFIESLYDAYAPQPHARHVRPLMETEWGRFIFFEQDDDVAYFVFFALAAVVFNGPLFIATWIPETRQKDTDGSWYGRAQIEMIEREK